MLCGQPPRAHQLWAAGACQASSHRIFQTPHKPAVVRSHRLQEEVEARRGQPQWTSWHLSTTTLALEFRAGQTAAEHHQCLRFRTLRSHMHARTHICTCACTHARTHSRFQTRPGHALLFSGTMGKMRLPGAGILSHNQDRLSPTDGTGWSWTPPPPVPGSRFRPYTRGPASQQNSTRTESSLTVDTHS